MEEHIPNNCTGDYRSQARSAGRWRHRPIPCLRTLSRKRKGLCMWRSSRGWCSKSWRVRAASRTRRPIRNNLLKCKLESNSHSFAGIHEPQGPRIGRGQDFEGGSQLVRQDAKVDKKRLGMYTTAMQDHYATIA